jgi:peroxiredoxin
MNKVTILLFALLFSINTVFAKDKEAYNIKIKINNISNTECYMGYHFAEKQYVSDTLKVDAKGNMIFSGTKPLDGGIYLVVTPNKKYFEVIIAGETEFSLETDTLDFVKNMKVKGSKENEWFYAYLNYMNDKSKLLEPLNKKYETLKANKDSAEAIRAKMSKIDKEVKEYKVNFMKEHPESFLAKIFRTSQDPEVPEAPKLANGRTDSTFAYKYFKSHFFDGVDFSDARLLRTPLIYNKYKQYLEKLTYQIPDSIAEACIYIIEKAKANKEVFKYTVVYTTSAYESSKIMGMDAVFVRLVEEYYNTGQAFWADSTLMFKISDRARVLKPLLLGKKAPNLLLYDDKNQLQPLWGVKAKYTVLCFWDPDCSHCKKTVPQLADIYHKSLKAKGFEVYGVCTETEEAKWHKFIEDNKLDWINVADINLHNHFRSVYDISSTPVIYILNEKKEIIAKKLGVEQIEEFTDNYMKMELKKKLN